MFTSTDLKAIITEARPIIERQLEDALIVAGFRTTVTDKGGDWGQVKALLKAMIQDERDEAGGNKRVTALLSKAENATAYADMLGLMNEKNSFDEPAPAPTPQSNVAADAGEASAATVSPATQSTAARKDVQTSDGGRPGPSQSVQSDKGSAIAGTQAPPVDTVIKFTAKPLRPYCLHHDELTKCGGYGKHHCLDCEKAHAGQIAVEPGGVSIPHNGQVA